jgi:hypothetical protein
MLMTRSFLKAMKYSIQQNTLVDFQAISQVDLATWNSRQIRRISAAWVHGVAGSASAGTLVATVHVYTDGSVRSLRTKPA